MGKKCDLMKQMNKTCYLFIATILQTQRKVNKDKGKGKQRWV